MTRHRPDEQAVRERLREQPLPAEAGAEEDQGAEGERAEDSGAAETAAASATDSAGTAEGAAAESEATPAAGTQVADQAEAEEAPESGGAEAAVRGEEAEAESLDPLAVAERERQEYLELAKRTQADFENYRKRAAKDAAGAGARAKVGLVRELLPVVDNLERALASASDKGDGLAEGVRLVHAELVGVLQRAGVESIVPAGAAFDPTEHEALSTRSEDGAEPGLVLDVVEKGYRLGEAIVRPARVIVSA